MPAPRKLIGSVVLLGFLIAGLTNCSRRNEDEMGILKEAVYVVAASLNGKDTASSSSYSRRHCEYQQTSIIDVQFDTREDAVRISNLIKDRLVQSGCTLLMYNSDAYVGSESNGWGGGI